MIFLNESYHQHHLLFTLTYRITLFVDKATLDAALMILMEGLWVVLVLVLYGKTTFYFCHHPSSMMIVSLISFFSMISRKRRGFDTRRHSY